MFFVCDLKWSTTTFILEDHFIPSSFFVSFSHHYLKSLPILYLIKLLNYTAILKCALCVIYFVDLLHTLAPWALAVLYLPLFSLYISSLHISFSSLLSLLFLFILVMCQYEIKISLISFEGVFGGHQLCYLVVRQA